MIGDRRLGHACTRGDLPRRGSLEPLFGELLDRGRFRERVEEADDGLSGTEVRQICPASLQVGSIGADLQDDIGLKIIANVIELLT